MVSNFSSNPNDIPTDKVRDMRKKGLTDNQIIQSLQHEGYNSQQTLEAMEMADLNQNAGMSFAGGPPPQTPMKQQPQSISSMPPPMNNNMPPPMSGPANSPAGISSGAPNQNQSNTDNNSQSLINDQDMEELIEAIIDEKWAEVEKDIGRIIEWKDSVDEKIGNLTAQVTDLKTNFNDLHKAILGKVGDYDKNILEVGTQLKAMEEVFSKVLPTFTDNVGELNRIADKLKGK